VPDLSPRTPTVDEIWAGARVVALPLHVRFRGLVEREVVLLRGPYGWGEFAPFVEYDDAEAARWLAAGLEAAWQPPVPVRRDRVPVNATVPAVSAVEVAGVLARFDGCTTAKVKVAEAGQCLDDDLARVAAVRDLLGPDARIRVDANGAWTLDDAVRALTALSRYTLEYAEQPCHSLDELRRLRLRLAAAGVEVPIAADESVRKADDPHRVVLAGAADLVVLKCAPSGGVRAALAVAEHVVEAGLGVVVSSALDSSVGLAQGVALAAALPRLDHACGLGTASLLAGDVAVRPLLPSGGSVPVGPVVPDDELMRLWAAPSPRVTWWRDRLRRCLPLMHDA
jgi:O-succinylbenzoate synthase